MIWTPGKSRIATFFGPEVPVFGPIARAGSAATVSTVARIRRFTMTSLSVPQRDLRVERCRAAGGYEAGHGGNQSEHRRHRQVCRRIRGRRLEEKACEELRER